MKKSGQLGRWSNVNDKENQILLGMQQLTHDCLPASWFGSNKLCEDIVADDDSKVQDDPEKDTILYWIILFFAISSSQRCPVVEHVLLTPHFYKEWLLVHLYQPLLLN